MNDAASYEHNTDPSGPGVSLGTILFGLILVSLGALWLLDVTDVFDVTWTLTGAIMLILVGVALILGAREGSHGGLVFLGFVLTAIVLLGTLVSWPAFSSDIGDRQYRPGAIEEVEESYNWGVGSQLVDLREIEFPEGETEIAISLGTGDLEIRIPEDVAYRVHWQVGLGNVQVVDRQHSGFGLNGTHESTNYDDRDRRLFLDIQVGLGAIEVRR